MSLPPRILELLACPRCGAGVEGGGGGAVCAGAEAHGFGEVEGFVSFAELDPGKYDDVYAARYAALWAYGYRTLHKGLVEGLYRTVSSLVAEHLVPRLPQTPQPVVVDAGCGVGRAASDCASLTPAGTVLAVDGSLSMLRTARALRDAASPVEAGLGAFGFPDLAVPPRPLENLFFVRGDVERLPVADSAADLVLSVNVIDRLSHGPERALAEAFRVLRSGGCLVFTDPLNFTDEALWRAYGTPEGVLGAFREAGFDVELWFDQLFYRELLDGRGSVEEFTTLVVKALRP